MKEFSDIQEEKQKNFKKSKFFILLAQLVNVVGFFIFILYQFFHNIRKDSAGHFFGQGNIQNRGSHFNLNGTNNHYDFAPSIKLFGY